MIENIRSKLKPLVLFLTVRTIVTVFLFTLPHAAAAVQDPPDSMPPPLLPETPSSLSPHASQGAGTFEDALVELVNQERWNNGQLPPLKRAAELDTAAETHSSNMGVRNFFGHCDLDTGSWPDDRMADAGYFSNNWGENIAAGYNTPASVMGGWMGSSGHRANILSANYREFGVGYFNDLGDTSGVRQDMNTDCVSDGLSNWPYNHYWTQNFGRRNSVYPLIVNREAYQATGRDVNLYMYGAGWAQEMRFCNAGTFWSDWQPYSPDASWTLTGGDGLKTVLAEIKNGDTVLSASDAIWLDEPANHPSLGGSVELYLPIIVRPLITGEYCPLS